MNRPGVALIRRTASVSAGNGGSGSKEREREDKSAREHGEIGRE